MTLINQEALQQMTGGSDEVLADLATLFVQLLPDSEARLRIAMDSQNRDEIGMIVHQLRSRVSYFGATDLREVAAKTEQRIHEGCMDSIGESCTELFAGMDDLLVELRTLTGLPLEKADD